MPLDLEAVRKQVGYALTREDAAWAGHELEHLAEMADCYLEAGTPTTAGAIYHLVLSETRSRFEDWRLEWDEDGDIQNVLDKCAEGLDNCLEQVRDPAIRQPAKFAAERQATSLRMEMESKRVVAMCLRPVLTGGSDGIRTRDLLLDREVC